MSAPDSAAPPPAVTVPEDRVPIAQKIACGLGTFHDMGGRWLYHTLAHPVFTIGFPSTPPP